MTRMSIKGDSTLCLFNIKEARSVIYMKWLDISTLIIEVKTSLQDTEKIINFFYGYEKAVEITEIINDDEWNNLISLPGVSAVSSQ